MSARHTRIRMSGGVPLSSLPNIEASRRRARTTSSRLSPESLSETDMRFLHITPKSRRAAIDAPPVGHKPSGPAAMNIAPVRTGPNARHLVSHWDPDITAGERLVNKPPRCGQQPAAWVDL
jgi:hypothetical protein